MRSHALTQQTALAVPDIALYDASNVASLTVASNLCSQMLDGGTNGATQSAAGSARPQSGINTINGLNVLTFGTPGTTNMQSANIANAAEPFSALVVARLSAVAASQRELFGWPGTNIGGIYQTAAEVWACYNGAFTTSAVSSDTTAHVFAVTFDHAGAGAKLYLDNTLIASGAGGSDGGSNVPLQLCSTWLGDFGEGRFFTGVLSGAQMTAQHGSLKSKWATL